jgi:hypothetical protein
LASYGQLTKTHLLLVSSLPQPHDSQAVEKRLETKDHRKNL